MKKKLLAVLLVVITVVPVFAGNGRFFLSLGPAGNYNSWKVKQEKVENGNFESTDAQRKFGGIGADFSVVIQPNKDSVFSIFIDEYAGFPIGKRTWVVSEDEKKFKLKFSFQDNLAFGPAATFGRNGDFLNGTIGLGPSLGYTSVVDLLDSESNVRLWETGLSLGVAAFGQLMFNINDMFYIDLVAVPSIRFIQWGRRTTYIGDKRTDSNSTPWTNYTFKGFEFDVKAKVGFGVKLGNKDM
ncbi:MAG: hypothetical protein MJ052_01840 [Sphaerochaetaceae bacterium]|nr:hypothetical protein [Sphaerochaetaceae bacterium]